MNRPTDLRMGTALAWAVLAAGLAAGDDTFRLEAGADASVTNGSFADRLDSAPSLRVSGFLFDPSAPGIAIEPAAPKAGDRLTVRVVQPAVSEDGARVSYAYVWHRQQGRPFVLVQSGPEPTLKTPVSAGDVYKVFVKALAGNRTADAAAEVRVAGPAGAPAPAVTVGSWGQFLERRAYVAFDVKALVGRSVRSARLALYARPDVSWKRDTADLTLRVYLVPRDRATFDEQAVTWRTQPLAALAAEPIATLPLPGREVLEDDPRWLAWSKLHGATWETRGRYANDFSNDPTHGVWAWREVDVTAAVQAEAAAGAAWLTFCLADAPRKTHARSDFAVRPREYQDGLYAPALIVTCR